MISLDIGLLVSLTGCGQEISGYCYQPGGGNEGPIPGLLPGSDVFAVKAASWRIRVSNGGLGHYSGPRSVLQRAAQ